MNIFSEEGGEQNPHALLPPEKNDCNCPRSKLQYMSHLTGEQRYEIARMLQAGCAKKVICIALWKDKSVLCRELKRNSSKRVYSAAWAQQYASERKECFRSHRKFTEDVKEHIVNCLTEEQWSVEQIVGDAKRRGIAIVSH